MKLIPFDDFILITVDGKINTDLKLLNTSIHINKEFLVGISALNLDLKEAEFNYILIKLDDEVRIELPMKYLKNHTAFLFTNNIAFENIEQIKIERAFQ